MVYFTHAGKDWTIMGEILEAFTSEEARRLTGVSPRRLQYWDETDFIRPSIAARGGRGSPRLYSFQDLIQLRIAAVLRDRLSLHALRRLKQALDFDAPFATVRFGITDGQLVYLGPAGQPEEPRRPGQIVMTFDVPLEEIRADLRDGIGRIRSRRGVGRVASKGGRPVVAGTRIRPATVRRLLASGWSRERILKELPDLRPADIDAATERRINRAG